MAWYNEDQPETLNFMVVGTRFSGHDLLQSSLSAHPKMVCHGDLFHVDEDIRRQEHEDYFGDSGKVPDWYQPRVISVEQYLNNKIFDNALVEEKAIGVCMDYSHFEVNDLWDYVDVKCHQGDFCLLHVSRNPIACFMDLQQACGFTGLTALPFPSQFSGTMKVDPKELIPYVRKYMALELKVNRLCGDRAVIPYHELLLDFKGTLRHVFKFLGMPYSPACIPNQKRLKLLDMRERIGNWNQLQDDLPSDVKEVLNSSTLF